MRHARWFEDMLPQVGFPALPRGLLQNGAQQDVAAVAVVPFRAGSELQRQVREEGDQLRQGDVLGIGLRVVQRQAREAGNEAIKLSRVMSLP